MKFINLAVYTFLLLIGSFIASYSMKQQSLIQSDVKTNIFFKTYFIFYVQILIYILILLLIIGMLFLKNILDLSSFNTFLKKFTKQTHIINVLSIFITFIVFAFDKIIICKKFTELSFHNELMLWEIITFVIMFLSGMCIFFNEQNFKKFWKFNTKFTFNLNLIQIKCWFILITLLFTPILTRIQNVLLSSINKKYEQDEIKWRKYKFMLIMFLYLCIMTY